MVSFWILPSHVEELNFEQMLVGGLADGGAARHLLRCTVDAEAIISRCPISRFDW